MLTELYKRLEVDGDVDAEKIASCISHDAEWALPVLYPTLLKHEPLPDHVRETSDILDMYRIIRASLRDMQPAERQKLLDELGHDADDLEFSGFDGNNDAHYGCLSDWMNILDRYQELQELPHNSHSSASLPRYRSMVRRFNERWDAVRTRHLASDDLKYIVTG
jgi:uncharacterized protein YfbU (UPF0304 family)